MNLHRTDIAEQPTSTPADTCRSQDTFRTANEPHEPTAAVDQISPLGGLPVNVFFRQKLPLTHYCYITPVEAAELNLRICIAQNRPQSLRKSALNSISDPSGSEPGS